MWVGEEYFKSDRGQVTDLNFQNGRGICEHCARQIHVYNARFSVFVSGCFGRSLKYTIAVGGHNTFGAAYVAVLRVELMDIECEGGLDYYLSPGDAFCPDLSAFSL